MPEKLIDVTVTLHSGIPVWPGSVGINVTRTMRLEAGDQANVSRLDCDVHIGTHIDAPKHVFKTGDTVEQLPLDVLVGPCVVSYLPNTTNITAEDLVSLAIPEQTKRFIISTSNSRLWTNNKTEFVKDYAALTNDAAQWIVDKGIELVGIDYLSIQPYDKESLVHRILLKAGVIILEGLNLTGVAPGLYELICLPLKLAGSEGAPARVVLRVIP